jgi:hypothetical protein
MGKLGDGYRVQFLARIAEQPFGCGIDHEVATGQIRNPHRHAGGLEDRPPPLLARAERRFRVLALLDLCQQGFVRALELRRPLVHRAFEILPSEAKGSLSPFLAAARGIGDDRTDDEGNEPRQISG